MFCSTNNNTKNKFNFFVSDKILILILLIHIHNTIRNQLTSILTDTSIVVISLIVYLIKLEEQFVLFVVIRETFFHNIIFLMFSTVYARQYEWFYL